MSSDVRPHMAIARFRECMENENADAMYTIGLAVISLAESDGNLYAAWVAGLASQLDDLPDELIVGAKMNSSTHGIRHNGIRHNYMGSSLATVLQPVSLFSQRLARRGPGPHLSGALGYLFETSGHGSPVCHVPNIPVDTLTAILTPLLPFANYPLCDDGSYALIEAARYGHASVVELILAQGGSPQSGDPLQPNMQDKHGLTALAVAAHAGNRRITAALLMAPGIDVTAAGRDSCTPLAQAMASQDSKTADDRAAIVEWLLQRTEGTQGGPTA